LFTFPNHVTLVTGVGPNRHGIVNNVFLDPERGLYRYDSDPSWIEVEPLWSLAARNGVVCAAFHWVGSEGKWTSGFGPRHWRDFDASVPEIEKVEQIFAWLDLADPQERPRLITSWFRGIDHAGHRYGPDSRQVAQALRRQDQALARLLRGLESRDLLGTTTLLLVSDHGITSVERVVDLQGALQRQNVHARVLGGGGFGMVSVAAEENSAERVVEIARRLGLEAYRRSAAPPPLRFTHPRFGDVIVLAPVGTAIARREGFSGFASRVADGLLANLGARPRTLRGAHGYSPDVPSMGGLFAAAGRGVRPGTRLGTLRSLDVAPTVLALLDLPVPEWMEGRPIAEIVPGLRNRKREWNGQAEDSP
jgi:predicted AlkP superfamily pyrophosphatase or phosphodiesterase